jgi:hypothetical protein
VRVAGLQGSFAADKGSQALMFLAAGRAAVQVCPQAGDGYVDVFAGELELDVAVELLEACVAADLRFGGAEEATEYLFEIRSLH